MKPKVYIETTVVSYLTAWPSRDLVIAGHQQITHEWWKHRLPLFDAVVSELVLEEAGRGDPKAAEARLNAIAQFPILEAESDAGTLAEAMVEKGLVPKACINDALHVSISALNGIDYLLTWNCRHLANAAMRHRIESFVEEFGYGCPIICTPEELMEDTP